MTRPASPLDPDAQAGDVLARARAVHPALPDRAPDEESRERMAELLEQARAAAAPAEREPGSDDGDDNLEPTGGTSHATGAGKAGPPPEPGAGADQPAPAPLHSPHVCKSCGAPIFWAQILDESGRRVRTESGRMKAMSVNAAADPAGNVVLFHREGEGIVCRVLRRGERPAPGAVLRTSHFASCPADQHRRRV